MKHWKPKYRSLGAPPPLPNYILFDDDHWHPEDFKGHKSVSIATSSAVESGPSASGESVFLSSYSVLLSFNSLYPIFSIYQIFSISNNSPNNSEIIGVEQSPVFLCCYALLLPY